MAPDVDPSSDPVMDPGADPTVVLTACPECGAPAEMESRFVLESTDGPIEHARVRCLRGHWFVLAVEWLTRQPCPSSRPSSSDGC